MISRNKKSLTNLMGNYGVDRNSKFDVGMFEDKNALVSLNTLDKSKSLTK